MSMPLNERDAPPVIPSSFKIYDSYTVDPQWQRTFTWIWLSVAGVSLVAALPSLVNACRSRRLFTGYLVSETLHRRTKPTILHRNLQVAPQKLSKARRASSRAMATYQSITFATLSLPRQLGSKADCCRRVYLPLSAGQIFLVISYIGAVIACLVKDAQLATNSNRAGFLALANLTPLLLLTLKNNPLALLLGLSYSNLNYLHRWAGRMTFLLATVHGGIWLKVMPSSRTSTQGLRGMASWVLLLALAISSVRPIRKRFYQVFFTLHLMCFVGFFAAVSYHTPYARPWIFPPIALYAADLALRLCRYRIKDAILVPLDDLTMIHIPDCDYGWLPTQHINIRVLSGPGIFESHSFTITNAASTRGITLYAKAAGRWTRSLHAMASTADEAAETLLEKTGAGKQVKVMIDGPYGGLHTELASVQEVLVIAGGSGITFALGTVEEALRSGGPSKVTVAWVCRDISTIKALSAALNHLSDLAAAQSVALIYDLYLTRPPTQISTMEDLPAAASIQPYRPTVAQIVREHLPPPSLRELEDGGEPRNCCSHGGLAVVACGPEGIVFEARNAVARLGVGERVRCGGVAFHGESYSL